jgi:prepilin-type N-terminal cleavage/methylation domain-containing protein
MPALFHRLTGSRRPRRGFTLVELLVAIVVLGLVLGLLLQLSSATFTATRTSHQALEAGEHARQALDALGADFAAMVTQNGAPMLTSSAVDSVTGATNVLFSFLTQSRGPSSGARSLGIYYQLGNGELQRLNTPVPWTETNPLLAVESAFPPNSTSATVAVNILRIDAALMLDNGTTVPLEQAGTWKVSTINGQAVPPPFLGLNFTDTTVPRVRAIVVGVAALDGQNYRLLSTDNMLGTICSTLASPAAGQTPVEGWEPAISTAVSSGAWAHIPRPAVAALQVIETAYSLPQ